MEARTDRRSIGTSVAPSGSAHLARTWRTKVHGRDCELEPPNHPKQTDGRKPCARKDCPRCGTSWGNTRLITSRGSSDALLNRLLRIVPLRTCLGCQNFARVSRRPSAAQQSYGFFFFGSGRRSPSPGWAARAHVLMRMGGDEGLPEGNGGFPTRGGGPRRNSYLVDCQAMVIGRVFQFQICERGTQGAATLPGGALKPKGGAAPPRNAARPFPG